jgi:predicted  nucleic acid-binding Zn-ribbon protein
VTHPLLALQAADTMADQLAHRRDHLAEREQVQAAKNDLVRWDQARMMKHQRLDELEASIERSEAESHEVDTHRERLLKQMKTIIAPREAEALQHELDALAERRSALDDAELAALEEQARLEDELTALLGQEESLRNTYLAADAALSVAQADIDGELARIAQRLDGLRAAVPPRTLTRYDRLRQQHVVAAATLSGSRCEGCHLDLSAHEIDDLKDEAAASGGVADCPQCGRLLVL